MRGKLKYLGPRAWAPTLINIGCAEVSDARAHKSLDAAISSLPTPVPPQAAQAATTSNLDPWRSALESTRAGLVAAAAAAQQQTYTRLPTALQQLLSAANATSADLLLTLAAALQHVDAAYLGQAATGNATGSGARVCVSDLAEDLQHLQESFFSFQQLPGVAPVVPVVLDLGSALGSMYDIAAAVTANGSSNSTSGLAAAVAAVRERLAALGGINATAIASGCAAVQEVLTHTNGSSALPDVGPTVELLTQLITRLDAMVPSVQLLGQKLSQYGNSTTSESYGELYDTATALDGFVGNATLLLAAPAPVGMQQVVSVAGNASAVAGGALQGQLLAAGAVVQGTTAWMQAAPYRVNAATGVLGAMAGGMARVAGAMVQGQEAQLAATQAAEGGNSTTTDGNGTAGDLPAFSLSALVAPYQQEIADLLQLLSNGMAAVQVQLDGAFGRVITPAGNSTAPDQSAYYSTSTFSSSSIPQASSVSADPLTPLPQPSPPPAPAANASTQIRQELVRRIENVILEVNGSTAVRYMDLTFWGSIALYTALIIFCLLLFISLWFNYPAGIVSTLLLFLLLLTTVLAGAWALSMSLVGTSDFCASTNTIVMQSISAGATLYPLARFYLQGVGGNLQNVIRTSGLGDTFRIAAALSAVQQQLVDPFLLPSRANSTTAAAAAAAAAAAGLQLPDPTTDGAWPGATGTVGYGLGGLLVDAGSLAVTASNELNTFLTLADRTSVMGQFQYVQSWGCCTVAGDAFVAWVCATACGLLAWVAAMAACLVLKNLDDMPGSGCCACKCYDPSDYQPSKRGAYSAMKRGSTSGCGGGGGGGGGATGRSAAAYLAGGAAPGGATHAPHPSPARLLQQQHSRRQGMLVHTPQSIQEHHQQQQGPPGSRAATPPDGIGRSGAAASAAAAALGGTPTRSRSAKKQPNEIDPDGPAAQLGLWDLATAPPLPAGHQHDWSPTVRIVRSPRDTEAAGGVRPSIHLTVLDEQTAAMLGLGGGQGQGHGGQQQHEQQQQQ